MKVIDPEPHFETAKQRDAWHEKNKSSNKVFIPEPGYKPKVVNGPIGEPLDLHYVNSYSGKGKAIRDHIYGFRGHVSKRKTR
jgi:hypothetical protein